MITTLLEKESYIFNKSWNFPHQNYSAVDAYDKSCHDEDQTTFPKGLFPASEAMCQNIAFEGTAWSWKKWTEKHSVEETVMMEVGNEGGGENNKAFQRRTCVKREIFKKYFCFIYCRRPCLTLLQRSRLKTYVILQGF